MSYLYESLTAPSAVLVTAPTEEPLTLAQLKSYARLPPEETSEDVLLTGLIKAARAKVECDTGLVLLTQTWDLLFDYLPVSRAVPLLVAPIQSVVTLSVTGLDLTVQPLAATDYALDTAGGRLMLLAAPAGYYRRVAPWAIRVLAGWPSVAALPPLLVHAVGLLAAHYATYGRDVLQVGHIVAETPLGYDDAIGPYKRVLLP